MNIWHLIKIGGITMVVLLILSIVSVAIILERYVFYYFKAKLKRKDFMLKIRQALKSGGISSALNICKTADAPFVQVVYAGLSFFDCSEKEISNNMERQVIIETVILERFTSIIGTIASVSVYIGLLGTITGILKAFHDVSVSGSSGMSVIIGGISEALSTTAAGLTIAIPAVAAYNYSMKKIEDFIKDMELAASETMDLVSALKK
ncbi:MAG: MotA/TolQ/ExbB proton channel family protein [Candidatus Omnitrophota bacterium]